MIETKSDLKKIIAKVSKIAQDNPNKTIVLSVLDLLSILNAIKLEFDRLDSEEYRP